ncbi:MAG TPA: hypothetical protein VFK00_08350 [Rhodanobacteraceae bacterium]|jgi:hypothetical protein|nr:hypothetical protein [Rhodanobacteraceae bacterium]
MIGAWLMLLCVAAVLFLIAESWRAWAWHHRGVGERKALVEYARIRREQPDTAEARLPEAEFVRYYVGLRPGIARYAIVALLLVLIGLPASCALMAGWRWD